VTTWRIEVRDPEDPGARGAVSAYAAELDALLGASSPTIVDPDPDAYRPPRGIFLVVLAPDGCTGDATTGDVVLGCAGLRTIELPGEGPVAEVKRMWVSGRMRGAGVGRALLQRLHEEARARGLTRVVLDSKRELLDARRLYLAAGYRDMAPYGANADATVWMGLDLPAATADFA
jgi:GNAT superfamily N-acetyltransferase